MLGGYETPKRRYHENEISPVLALRFKNPLIKVDIQTGELLINRLDRLPEYYGYYKEEDINGRNE